MSALDGSKSVLTIPAAHFWEYLGNDKVRASPSLFHFPPWSVGRFLGGLLRPSSWTPRTQALEEDETVKQIIGYVLVRRGPEWLWYRRAPDGGEARLHRKKSLGFGGHTELTDVPELTHDDHSIFGASAAACAAVDHAVRREIEEEIGIPHGTYRLRPIGILNDDSDPVGRVHLGIVMVATIHVGGDLTFDPAEIEEHGWLDGRQLAIEPLHGPDGPIWEGWSSALFSFVINETSPPGPLETFEVATPASDW